MTNAERPEPAYTDDSNTNSASLSPPLQGCLVCHSEGATYLAEQRKFLGLGGSQPMLTCRVCGSVAQLEQGSSASGEDWRIRYKKVNRDGQYYYASVFFGAAGWLDADAALHISRNGYVQRMRVAQTERGDISWLRPTRLNPPPPLMSFDESVYLTLNPIALAQTGRSQAEMTLDTGIFYLTDKKVHLLGQRRDWSHRLDEIQSVEYTDQYWRINLTRDGQHYQGNNHPDLPDKMDAQLFVAVLRAVIGEYRQMT